MAKGVNVNTDYALTVYHAIRSLNDTALTLPENDIERFYNPIEREEQAPQERVEKCLGEEFLILRSQIGSIKHNGEALEREKDSLKRSLAAAEKSAALWKRIADNRKSDLDERKKLYGDEEDK